MFLYVILGWVLIFFGAYLIFSSIAIDTDRELGIHWIGIAGVVCGFVLLMWIIPSQKDMNNRINRIVQRMEVME